MPAPRVSVVVPARDAAALLGTALAALAAQEGAPPFEVVVVDDGSTDATDAIARASGARVVEGAGEGPARARNRGVAAAVGEVLAFTDADCEPEPGWLRAAVAALDSGADVVQGWVGPPDKTPRGPWDRTLGVIGVALFETANLVVRREAFDRAGGFESWLGGHTAKELGEDALLGWTIVRGGGRAVFVSEARVRHAVFPRGPGAYVSERARLRFFPALARRVPELREVFFHRRVFLNPRQARFDAAILGLVTRRPVLAAPYALAVARDARRRGARVAGVEVGADAVSLGALLVGSVRARTLLL